MKGKSVFFIILLIVLADQALKVYIKTNFFINESHNLFGSWGRLHFVENEGMAYGWKFGGETGKIILTLFRLGAVIFGAFYIKGLVAKKEHKGFIFCAALIFAGALGNLIDSMFYGLIFNESVPGSTVVATIFPKQGYAGFLHGKVVDMLYFPIITNTHFPDWVPVWGGEDFEFFRPIFNIADAAISSGIISILVFQKRFFANKNTEPTTTVETSALVNDDVQVQ